MSIARRFVWPMMAAAAIAGGSYFGTVESGRVAVAQGAPGRPTPVPQVDTVAPAQDLSRAFRAVHDSLKDAVVNINVTKRAADAGNMQIPDEMRGMLPPGFEDQLRRGGGMQRIEGTGSGVIVNPDG